MKKVLFSCALFSCALVYAQEPADALRLSYTIPSGTARHQAIGGAMGSLGGDITATYVNPAGLAFYKTGDVVLSPSYRFGKNKGTYLGRTEKGSQNKFDLGTSGVIYAAGSNQGRVRSHAVSLALNTTADFRNNILYRGVNTQSSYSQQFVEELGNNNIKTIDGAANGFPFGSSLAFNTYWIDSSGSTAGIRSFRSRAGALAASGLIQEQKIETRGGIYEPSLGFAINYSDKLMLGGSVSIPYVYYNREATFTEADATDNPNNEFDFATLKESVTRSGLGFNAKAGVIYKPQEFWRLGFAIHSPTIYGLRDENRVDVTTDTEKYKGLLSDNSTTYPDAGSDFRYSFVTPYKIIGSISYVLREIQDVTKQKGFLTADVEYINHKASSYQPENSEEAVTSAEDEAYLESLNEAIDKSYKGAFNFRAGGELKFTTLMVRLGAAYYGNPYKDIRGEKGSKLNLSGGLGYRNKGLFVDLAYVHSMNKEVLFPYRLQNGFSPRADVRIRAGNVLLTFGVKI
ncbi:MAG: hypothetical protein WKF70_08995 [Chitinophagaceae bacterium]